MKFWSKKGAFGWLSGGLLLTAILAGCSKSAAPVTEVVDAPLDQLVQVDGRLHLEGEGNPFHGFMVEFYPDGSRKARSSLQEGILHGLSEGWFMDGNLQVREEFSAGVSHGVRTRYYPDGGRLSEAEIVEGEFHGLFRRWHENGALAEETHFVRGRPDGASIAYYASGYVRASVTLSEGKILEQKSWKDGQRKMPL